MHTFHSHLQYFTLLNVFQKSFVNLKIKIQILKVAWMKKPLISMPVFTVIDSLTSV